MVNWGAVSAVATAFTGIVVAVTVIVGVRQLRLTAVQLEQLRRATQLDGAMRVFDIFQSPTYIRARRFVATDLPTRLQDEAYRREVTLGHIFTRQPEAVHEELFILRTYEAIGSYVERGLLDREVIMDTSAISIIVSWLHLLEVIAIQRRALQPRMWENFERIYQGAVAWFVERAGSEGYDSWVATIRSHRPD